MIKFTLLISCKDKKGIIAGVTSFVSKYDGNITYIDQYVERVENGVFFMRLECEFDHTDFGVETFRNRFDEEITRRFSLDWELFMEHSKIRMAVFVSKYDHCLYDILARYASREFEVEIPLVISNHNDLEHVAQKFDIPFYHIPVSKENKDTAEDKQIELLTRHEIDFVVLARYMQILSPKIINKYPNKIINIHHSFLPAFPGAKPYHSAYKRGVKIIGATSHYVNKFLDEGPIIEQDTVRVSHLNSVEDLVSKGKDLERIVLSRAINLHISRKIKVYNNRTVIFS